MKVSQQRYASLEPLNAAPNSFNITPATRESANEQLERVMARSMAPAVSNSGARGLGIHAELSYAINGAAIEVHRHIGPGQLEALYERALCEELAMRGLECRSQVAVKALYKDRSVGNYYADIVVENKVIVELKVVSRIAVAHRQQVLTYLRASGLRLGLIMNFNAPVLWREIKRVVL
ncbi:MAG TPA: GxxExxY protein [Kofleriaceae bacterium]